VSGEIGCAIALTEPQSRLRSPLIWRRTAVPDGNDFINQRPQNAFITGLAPQRALRGICPDFDGIKGAPPASAVSWWRRGITGVRAAARCRVVRRSRHAARRGFVLNRLPCAEGETSYGGAGAFSPRADDRLQHGEVAQFPSTAWRLPALRTMRQFAYNRETARHFGKDIIQYQFRVPRSGGHVSGD